MIGERDLAALAAEHQSAVAALDKGGSSSAIQEQDYLLSTGCSLAYPLCQGAAENTAVAGFKLGFHVYNLNFGQGRHRPQDHAFREPEQLVVALLSMIKGDYIGCGAAHNHYCPGGPGKLYGGITGVVAGRFIRLFVGPFVLFIDNNKAKIGLGGENSASGADDHVELSVFYAVPFVKLLTK